MNPASDNAQPLTRRTWLWTGLASAAILSPDLLPAQEKATTKPTRQAYDDVKPQEFSWGWIRWLMNAQIDPQAEMTLGIVQIEPNQSNPLHVHPNCTEYLHVLSGTSEHRVGDQWFTLKAGDTLRIPRNVAHKARTGKEACRTLVVYNTGSRQMVSVKE